MGRGALNSGWGPLVLWSRSSRGCCSPWPLGPAIAMPALSLLWVPSSSVLKPYLGEQKADRHIKIRDCPVHRAGASVVPIRKPSWLPGLWSVRPSVAPAGLLSANESLDPLKRGVPAWPQAASNPPLGSPTFGPSPQAPAPARAQAYMYLAPNAWLG